MSASHLSLRRMYNHYNRKYFDNRLPADTILVWEPTNNDRTAETEPLLNGQFKIRIDPGLRGLTKHAKIDLLHEMAHIERALIGGTNAFLSHGKAFKDVLRRLMSLSVYDELL